MKWTHSELLQSGKNVNFDTEAVIDPEVFRDNARINGTRDIRVTGHGFLDDHSGCFYADINVSGVMLIPDAVTGKEIEYPFETGGEEVFACEDTGEDGVWIVTDDVIDLYPAVIAQILMEVPMQVTIASSDEYPSGDGWRVISEEEYQKSQEDRIDPRLAKLKEFKSENQ